MPARLDRLSIILVEDHANMRGLWRSIFVGFGIRDVREASTAMAAIDYLHDREADLLIVDQNLDDLSGAELVRMIRRSKELPSLVPVIACTADTRRSTLRELVNAGCDEILAKPVSAQHAWAKIASIVNNRRPFVRTSIHFGPDRRRRTGNYNGPERRDVVEFAEAS